MALWLWIASPAVSIVMGLVCFCALHHQGKHRDAQGRLIETRIGLSILQGAAFYTIIVCLFGNWFLHIPIHETVRDGFGDQRMAWLLAGIGVDVFARLYKLFDPH